MNFNKTYKIIIFNYFFYNLINRFYCYLYYYYEYNLNQIKRYSIYKLLIFIIESLISHHTIIVDFILILFFNFNNINIIMIIIYKFFKRNIVITNKNI